MFLLGTPRYTRKLPGGDCLRGLCHYLWASARTSAKGAVAFSGWVVLIVFLVLSVVQAFITDHTINEALSYTALGLAAYSCIALGLCHVRNHDIRAMPEHPHKLLTPSDAADTLDVVPVMLVVNVGFMLVYNTMNGYEDCGARTVCRRVAAIQLGIPDW